ncbi:unnamed protein product [Caenorhabditis auriculariae]|uniref:Uncharacterized protein n=1 Tax=Caenorhabditis auriculariae TaxID=2777116 RepID=A0A8S1HPB1_9PELO|nr:unnamed protein product [Caenorhabditis auriculariae]
MHPIVFSRNKKLRLLRKNAVTCDAGWTIYSKNNKCYKICDDRLVCSILNPVYTSGTFNMYHCTEELNAICQYDPALGIPRIAQKRPEHVRFALPMSELLEGILDEKLLKWPLKRKIVATIELSMTAVAYDHITLKTRHPVRSGKLSNVESR